MIIDGSQLFSGSSNGSTAAITSGQYTDAPTSGTQIASNIIDYGVVSGLPTSASGGGARDMGIGDNPALKLSAFVTTTFAGGTSLQLQLQGAPDNGSGSAGSYYTLWTGFAIVEAQLLAGAVISNIDFPREMLFAGNPGGPIRFLKLNYISAGTHTAGLVEAYIALDQEQAIFSGVSGVVARSAYPAGITIAN